MRDTSNETIIQILNYFLWYSAPKTRIGGKIFYVLNSNEFGKEHGIKRPTFAKYKDELLVSKFIVEIPTPKRVKGIHYSITPLGLCYLAKAYHEVMAISSEQLKRYLSILESFVDEPIAPFNSIIFDKSFFRISNLKEKLLQSINKGKIRTHLPTVMKFFVFEERFVHFKFPLIYNLLEINLLQFRFEGSIGGLDATVRLLEHSPDLSAKYEFQYLKTNEFHHYVSLLIIATLIFYIQRLYIDPNYIKMRRDLTKVLTKDYVWKKGKIIKPDLETLRRLDSDLMIFLIKFNAHLDSIISVADTFYKSTLEVARKQQFKK